MSLLKGLYGSRHLLIIFKFTPFYAFVLQLHLPINSLLTFLLLACRMEAFNSVFGQHMRANRLDLITITELEEIVNTGTDAHYSRAEITFLLEVKLIFN